MQNNVAFAKTPKKKWKRKVISDLLKKKFENFARIFSIMLIYIKLV